MQLAGKRRVRLMPYLLISPFFIGYILFSLYPTVYALYLSFFNWDGMNPMKWIGTLNYEKILNNRAFLNALRVSLIFIMTGPVATLCGLASAVLLNSKMVRGRNFFRLSFFTPYVTMPIAIGVLFTMMLGWDYGVLNRILLALRLLDAPVNWLGERSLVFFCMSLVVTWRYFGYHMIIYMGGLQSIDDSLYEAARIDGAGTTRSFFSITLPLLKPYIVYLLITSISGGMSMFDEPMMLYSVTGGPGGIAQNVGMLIYQQTFVSNRWGYGSAMSFISFAIIAVLSLMMYRVSYRGGMEK